MGTSPTATLERYLHRLGEEGTPPPTYDTLRRLCRAHVRAVPWQSLHVQLDEVTAVDGRSAAARLAGGRSGYCFHLNGAFAWLLDEIGFAVERHRAGVMMPGDVPVIDESHLTLVVCGQPAPGWDDGRWLVDVSLVDVLDEPLALRSADFSRDGWTFRLRPSEVASGASGASGAWRLDHDPRGSFVGIDIGAEVVDMDAFTASHQRQSREQGSLWRRWAIAERRVDGGTLRLVGCELTTWQGEESSTVVLTEERSWVDALRLLNFEVDAVPADDLHALWLRITAGQHKRGNGAAGSSALPATPSL